MKFLRIIKTTLILYVAESQLKFRTQNSSNLYFKYYYLAIINVIWFWYFCAALAGSIVRNNYNYYQCLSFSFLIVKNVFQLFIVDAIVCVCLFVFVWIFRTNSFMQSGFPTYTIQGIVSLIFILFIYLLWNHWQ